MPMPYGQLAADDFQDAALALCPSGPAFPRDRTTVFAAFWGAVGDLLAQLHADAVRLFDVEADPTQARDLLPDWMAAFGVKSRGTHDQQRANLALVIGDPGGFTEAHYVALAATLGISITVANDTAFVWKVHAPASLGDNQREDLEALIDARNRATCQVTFHYDL